MPMEGGGHKTQGNNQHNADDLSDADGLAKEDQPRKGGDNGGHGADDRGVGKRPLGKRGGVCHLLHNGHKSEYNGKKQGER